VTDHQEEKDKKEVKLEVEREEEAVQEETDLSIILSIKFE
jgi:hypothetical protein